MQFKANAKINLGLFIKSKRPDGYHDLESIFVPIDWCDEIEITEAKGFSFDSSGIEIPNDSNKNLIVQAYDLLNYEFNLPALNIHLQKNVPIGAGLGGGSADAAFSLKALNEAFFLGIDQERLEELALELGSDCPFFIQNKPALVTGRGEVFDYNIDLDLKGYKLIVVVPDIHISTAKAYSMIEPNDQRESLRDLLKLPINEWKNKISNDFETVLCKEHKELDDLRNLLLESDPIYSSMSGSGAAFFALYKGIVPNIEFPESYRIYRQEFTT